MAVDSATLMIGDKTLALLGGHICKSPEKLTTAVVLAAIAIGGGGSR